MSIISFVTKLGCKSKILKIPVWNIIAAQWSRIRSRKVNTDLTDLTHALSLPVEHRPQTTYRFHPALELPPPSSSNCTGLKPTVNISFSKSLFQLFLGLSLPLQPCDIHYVVFAWRRVLSLLISTCVISVCQRQFYCLLLICFTSLHFNLW